MAYYNRCEFCGCNLDPGEICECRSIEPLKKEELEPFEIMDLLNAPDYIIQCVNYFLYNNTMPRSEVILFQKDSSEGIACYDPATNNINISMKVIFELVEAKSREVQVRKLLEIILHEMAHMYNHIYKQNEGKDHHGINYIKCAEKHGLKIITESGKMIGQKLDPIGERLMKHICSGFVSFYHPE